jgi:putative ABC transport system permease protein
MNLAVKDIRHSFGRFALTSVGIGMLLMIVMGMGGIYRGIIADATLLVDRVGADLWIVQRDTKGPFAELSRIQTNLAYRATSVPGVAQAREFVYHTIQREYAEKPLRMAVLGLSWPTDRGEWVPLVAGRSIARNHYEMIADKTLQLPLGEHIRLGKETYRVVGICENMISSSGDGIGFFTVLDAQAIQLDVSGEAVRLEREARRARGQRSALGSKQPMLVNQADQMPSALPAIARPRISAVMVRMAPGTSTEEVASIISGWDDVSVYTQQGQKELLLRGTVEKIRRQIGLFRVLLTIIAAVIMALIIYTLTLEKLHSIALLKLIGAPNRLILGLILQQSLLLGAVGYAIAFLLGQKVFPQFPRRVILLESDLLQLGIIILGISVLASLLGIWKALHVQPNEALA